MPEKKFGRYGKRGGDQKINYTPSDISTNNNTEPRVLQRHDSTSAERKVTKMQIIRRLSIVTRSYQKVQIQNKVTLSANCSLIKKVSKSNEVMEGLCICLKNARQEMRSTKSNLVKALQDHASTKNASLFREQKHQSQIAAMEKNAEATLEQAKRGHKIVTAKIISKSESKLAAAVMKHKRVVNTITKLERVNITAKDDLHAMDLEKKNNKISISPSFNIITLLSSITHNFVVRP